MTRHILSSCPALAAKIVLLLPIISVSSISVAAQAQQTTSGVAEDSIQTLAKKIEELNKTIQDLRSEISQSREETREIREELRRVREAPGSISSNSGQKEQSATTDELNRIEENQQLLSDKVD